MDCGCIRKGHCMHVAITNTNVRACKLHNILLRKLMHFYSFVRACVIIYEHVYLVIFKALLIEGVFIDISFPFRVKA